MKGMELCMIKVRKLLIKLFPQFMKSKDLIDILTNHGIHVGKSTHFYYPSSIMIDMQRPWMIEIGDYCKITKGVIILAHDYSRAVFRRSHNQIIGEAGKTKIGNNVFIGMNAIILMGCRVGNNCIVGAGSVLSGNYPDNCVIAGNPARVICSLNEYVEKRKKKEDDEAFLYAISFYQAMGRMPEINEMGPFFHLFLERNPIELKRNNISLNWTGDEESEILENFMATAPKYDSFEEFLSAAKEWASTKGKMK